MDDRDRLHLCSMPRELAATKVLYRGNPYSGGQIVSLSGRELRRQQKSEERRAAKRRAKMRVWVRSSVEGMPSNP